MHCLLGKLHRANGDLQRAADAYAQALLANPFMWDAFTDLYDSGPSTIKQRYYLSLTFIGVTLDLSNIFRPRSSNIPTRETAIMSMPAELASPAAGEKDETMEDPADAVAPSRVSPRGFQVPAKRKQDTMAGALPLEQLTLQSDEPRSTSILSPERRTARLSPYPLLTNRGSIYRDGQLFRAMLEPKSRQPLRENQPTASTPRAKQDTKTGKAKVVAPSPKTPSRPAVLHTESSTALYGTFLTLGTAYYNLKRFQPRACLDALATLPVTQQWCSPRRDGRTTR